mgnify:CR=1 FL=1
MVRVTIDTIRVSLVSPQRIVVLREEDGERHVPIWIGPYEAEALTLSLRGTNVQRPLTHDLIKNMIDALDLVRLSGMDPCDALQEVAAIEQEMLDEFWEDR